ncbi:unnamed protein product [Moneuplotes crassus]|uniref:Uncharacterized protein n=1 Tax=Euplotes crassus TaxID=5936 RepID=A0AAD2DBN5_EUPCR|nr:unnamed protein product [Moneuplotes crassus]
MDTFVRSEFDTPSFYDLGDSNYDPAETYNLHNDSQRMPTIVEENSMRDDDNFEPPPTFAEKDSWSFTDIKPRKRNVVKKTVGKNKKRTTFKSNDAMKYIDQINRTHNASMNQKLNDEIYNTYKMTVDEDINDFESSKLYRRASQGKIRGYTNITSKNKEDLIQMVEDLKNKINQKDRVIKSLKVRNNKMKMNKDETTGVLIKSEVGQRPKSGHHLSQSTSFLAIPKDKERLEEEIRHLKCELNQEKTDKTLLKTEFNRLREFLGKIKKERMSEARRNPPPKKVSKTKNLDLDEILSESDSCKNNGTGVTPQEDKATKLRLQITKLQTRITDLKAQLSGKDEIIGKLKSKSINEVEMSTRLRKSLLNAQNVIDKLKTKIVEEKIQVKKTREDKKLEEILEEVEAEAAKQAKIDAQQRAERQKLIDAENQQIQQRSLTQGVTTRIEGAFTPQKQLVAQELLERNKGRPDLAPSEFTLGDNRIDYKVDKTQEFDALESDQEFPDTPEKKEETKEAPILDEEPQEFTHRLDEPAETDDSQVLEPRQFKIGDDRIEFQVNPSQSDKFSETEDMRSVAESSQAEGLFEAAQKFDGDQNLNLPDMVQPVASQASIGIQATAAELPPEELKKIEERENVRNLVNATISAWSAHPDMARKEIDTQYEVIRKYKNKIEDLQCQLSLKSQEIEKKMKIDNIRTLENKKKELERENVILLEREKRRIAELKLRSKNKPRKWDRY